MRLRRQLERLRFLGVGDLRSPVGAVLVVPTGVEDGVDVAPGFGSRAVEAELGAEDVQAATVDLRWLVVRVPEELADVEAAVADQPLGIDRQPGRAGGSQNVVV